MGRSGFAALLPMAVAAALSLNKFTEDLKQAYESAKTALKATEAGYEVGTRTAVDVLTARRQVFLAEARLKKPDMSFRLFQWL